VVNTFFQKVLVGADGTEHSQAAIDAAIAIAERFKSEIHCIGVIPPLSPETEAEGVGLEQANESRKSVEDQVTSCASEARSRGLQAITELLHGKPESEIEQYALERKIDLIVVGHRHVTRLRRFLEGSTSEGLVEHSYASVLVVTERPHEEH
jgi:nucleotide-binding universal stress UspA family protein